MSSKEHDTVALESKNNDDAADDEESVTDEAVTSSTPKHTF